ncbi:hypothetical protein GG344DRAFT_71173 [Lentinula edodes]|nr:hypothetical protein GG344DRAFT_71173 [Lentinula edodes]
MNRHQEGKYLPTPVRPKARLATDPKQGGRVGEGGGGDGEVGDSCSGKNRGTWGWEPTEEVDTGATSTSRDGSTIISPNGSVTGSTADVGAGVFGPGKGVQLVDTGKGRNDVVPPPSTITVRESVIKKPLDTAYGSHIQITVDTSSRLHVIQGQPEVMSDNVKVIRIETTTKEGHYRFDNRPNVTVVMMKDGSGIQTVKVVSKSGDAAEVLMSFVKISVSDWFQ